MFWNVSHIADSIIVPGPYYDKYRPICADGGGVEIISANMELQENNYGASFVMKVEHFEKAFHTAQTEVHYI